MPPQQCSITLTLASSLARRHSRACRRFEKLPVHARRNLRAALHAQVVAKQDDIDAVPHRRQVLFQVSQVDPHQPVEESVGAGRVFGQQHQKAVDAVEELPSFQQVTTKQSDNSAVSAAAQATGAFGQLLVTVRSGDERPRRGLNGAPHLVVQGLFQVVQVILFQEGPVALLEIQGAIRHARNYSPGLSADHPLPGLPFRAHPGRQQAGRAIRQNPFCPILLLQSKTPPKLDGIHPQAVQHVLIDDGQLLGGIIDADRARLQAQGAAQPGVERGGDAGRAVPAEIDRRPVRLLVVEGGQDALAVGQGSRRHKGSFGFLFLFIPIAGQVNGFYVLSR